MQRQIRSKDLAPNLTSLSCNWPPLLVLYNYVALVVEVYILYIVATTLNEVYCCATIQKTLKTRNCVCVCVCVRACVALYASQPCSNAGCILFTSTIHGIAEMYPIFYPNINLLVHNVEKLR